MPGQPCNLSGTTTCGDGKLDLDEECDDGNSVGGDGCSSTCKIESGFTCTTATVQSTTTTICQPACGDGIVAGAEECDLGAIFNTGDYGGCTSSCIFGPHCGDGIVNGAEECDDGILDGSYGGCTTHCRLGPHCGDGIVQAAGGEECDLGGNNGKTSSCSSTCKILVLM
jgi:cysteine-rich repeat protein